jgi:hypothetical protein
MEQTSNDHLCSATIADLTSGCGGTNYPYSVEGEINGMTNCGPNMFAFTMTHATPGNGDVVLRTANATDADLDFVMRGLDGAAHPGAGICMNNPYDMVFDGLNIWFSADLDNNAGNNQLVAVKVDIAQLSLVDTNQIRSLTDISKTFIISPTTSKGFTSIRQKIAFDGRDIWVVGEYGAGQTNSGKTFRLPLAIFR